ncbi:MULTISPECIES: fimbrillin family protein [Parabacteroides]|jgi:hypothetical protein|uniref:fimbrillin family protein n=1 Tax=Parabacteroides TaxID=375288 RepID=UPI00061777AD|nr:MULTISPECIES: hypothetical protein [Parabacteroides]KKB51510.1 hypothetical protein HMPREF1212_02240 [Parabacteroides sp. HGS0025]RGP16428.1 hypothetical protein DXB27_13080 [Parabacteroides gordonii]
MSGLNIKTVYLAGYLLLSLAACSSEERLNTGEGEEHLLEIGASISEPVVSRALGAVNYEKSSFVENDIIKIGTSADNLSAGGTSYTYTNNSGTLRWLPTGGGDGITTNGTGDYYASYDPKDYTGILANQSTVNAYQQSNRLITAATAVSGNKVNFSFYPAASKITVTVEYKDDLHVGESVQLVGNNLYGASTSDPVTLYPVTSTGKKHVYVAIVYPGSKQYRIKVTSKATEASEGVAITFPKEDTSAESRTLQAGYNYTYNFTSTFGLILNSVSVEGFQPGTGNGTENNWGAS